MDNGERRNRPWSSVGDDMNAIHAGRVARPIPPTRTDVAAPRKRRPLSLVLGGGLAVGLVAGVAVIASVRDMPKGPAPRPVLAAATPRVAPPETAPALPAITTESQTEPQTQDVATTKFAALPIVPRAASQWRSDAEEGDDDAPLSRADVLAADRALRAAYDDAVEAGVDRRRLVSIRNRWARLSATEYDRPERLVAAYSGMTDQLEAATDGERY